MLVRRIIIVVFPNADGVLRYLLIIPLGAPRVEVPARRRGESRAPQDLWISRHGDREDREDRGGELRLTRVVQVPSGNGGYRPIVTRYPYAHQRGIPQGPPQSPALSAMAHALRVHISSTLKADAAGTAPPAPPGRTADNT